MTTAHRYKYHLSPGHHGEDPDTLHFAGLCEGCDAVRLAELSLAGAEHRMRQGEIPDDWWTAYHHVWATSADRFNTYGWDTPPEDADDIRRVGMLRDALKRRVRKLRSDS